MSRRYRHFPGPHEPVRHNAHYIAMYPHPPLVEDVIEARRLVALAKAPDLPVGDPAHGQQVAARGSLVAHGHIVEVAERYRDDAAWHAEALRPRVQAGRASADEETWLARYDGFAA